MTREQQIYDYLNNHYNRLHKTDWVSPTEIGKNVWGAGYHSSSASPVCLRMVKKGILERSSKGHYRIGGNRKRGE